MAIVYTYSALQREIKKALKDSEKQIRQAYLDGVRTGRAEVLTALADSTRNLNRKYGSPE